MMEDYTVPIGKIRREWENPTYEMLCWLYAHKVGCVTMEDYPEYRVYEYNLDDGRKVYETVDFEGITFIAIEGRK